MTQSLTDIVLHIVFSTKDRRPSLHSSFEKELHNYISGIAVNLECPVIAINSLEDHIHILLRLSKNIAVKDLIMKLKSNSSRWIKSQSPQDYLFSWQSGYGGFSISRSNISKVVNYIASQKERHKNQSFQDEFLDMLKMSQINFSEKYLWE